MWLLPSALYVQQFNSLYWWSHPWLLKRSSIRHTSRTDSSRYNLWIMIGWCLTALLALWCCSDPNLTQFCNVHLLKEQRVQLWRRPCVLYWTGSLWWINALSFYNAHTAQVKAGCWRRVLQCVCLARLVSALWQTLIFIKHFNQRDSIWWIKRWLCDVIGMRKPAHVYVLMFSFILFYHLIIIFTKSYMHLPVYVWTYFCSTV